jgi:hypothetical protein
MNFSQNSAGFGKASNKSEKKGKRKRRLIFLFSSLFDREALFDFTSRLNSLPDHLG